MKQGGKREQETVNMIYESHIIKNVVGGRGDKINLWIIPCKEVQNVEPLQAVNDPVKFHALFV